MKFEIAMKILIVDDENLVREQIKHVLKSVSDIVLVGEAGSVSEALLAIRLHKPDLLLLDVELADGTGFDVLEMSDFSGHVIFVTAFSNYAINAFRAGAIDYLLKPLQPEEFNEAYNRVLTFRFKSTRDQLEVAKEALEKKESERLIVKTQEAIHVLKYEEVVFCKSDSSYTVFHLIDGRAIMVAKTLKEFELILSKSFFFRSHRGYLVNMKEVQRVDKNDMIVLRNGDSVPLAFRKKDAFLRQLGRI